MLQLFLQVVAHEQLGIVTDGIVDAAHPLPAVLVEGDVLHPVVSARGVGVGIRRRNQLHQCLSARIDRALRNDAAGKHFQSSVVQLRRGAAARGLGAERGKRRRAEIAAGQIRGGNGGRQNTRVQGLEIILVPSKEEELFAVLVERRSGNQHGAADVAAREKVLVFRLARAGRVIQPVIAIHRKMAGIEITLAVVITAAGLGNGTDHRGTLGVLRAEVRREDLELLDHVGVGVHRRGAVAAGIGNVRAISSDVGRVGRKSVHREGVVQSALAAAIAVAVDANHLTGEIGSVFHTRAGNRHAGQDLDELRSATADNREILKLFGGQHRRLFARVHRRDLFHRRRHFHFLAGGTNLQHNVVQVPLVGSRKGDARALPLNESWRLDRYRISACRNGSNGEIAVGVGLRLAEVAGRLVLQGHDGVGHNRLRRIGDSAGQCARNGLTESG